MVRIVKEVEGRTGAGSISAVGLRVGDLVVSAVATSSSANADKGVSQIGYFSSVIIDDDYIYQISGDLSGATILIVAERELVG